MKLRLSTINIWVLILLLLLSKNMLDIINENVKILGFTINNLFLIPILIFTLCYFIQYNRVKVSYQFSWYIIGLIIFIFISAYQTHHLIGQPILSGIFPQRSYLLMLFAYFPLRKYFVVKNINPDSLLEAIMNLGTFSSLVYILQKIVYLKFGIQFIHVAIGIVGNFSAYRMYVGSSLIIVALLISVYKFLETNKLKYIIHFIIGWITQLWITQGRAEITAIVISIGVGVIFFVRLNIKGIFLSILSFSFLAYMTTTSIFTNIVSNLLGKNLGKTGDTLTIRNLGKELYFTQLKENIEIFLFGTGYPNMSYYPSYIKSGQYRKIFLSDNGIISFFYIFGLIGFMIALLFAAKYVFLSFKLAVREKKTIYLMYIISLIAVGYNIILWYWDSDGMLLLILMTCLLEQELNYKRKKEEELYE